MRKLLLVPLLFLVSACKGETAKDVTSAVVGKTVEVAKGAGSGVVEGLKEGRKGAESTDGSRTLSTPEEVFANADVTVLEARPVQSGGVELVLAVANKTAQPLHLLGLNEGGGAQLIDSDGFATPLQSHSPGQSTESIKVPPSVKVKASIFFDGDAKKVAKVRLWNKELAVPAAATAAAPTP